MFRRAFIAATILPLLPAVVFASSFVELFHDDFENAIPANSTGVVGFWKPVVPANATLVESAGRVTLTSGGPSSPNGTVATYLYSGEPVRRFNFFRQRLSFSASTSIEGTAAAGQSLLRFSITGAHGSSYTIDDALTLTLRADGVISLAIKHDRPFTATQSATKLIEHNASGAITGFDLTLDAENYALVIRRRDGSDLSFGGVHGAIFSRWGVDGDSAFQLEAARASGTDAGAGQATVVFIDDFFVRRPSPLFVFEDGFENGRLADSDADDAVWTHSLSETGSAGETTGRLFQTAAAPNAATIIAGARTAISPRFNFFDRQLKFSASFVVGGNAAEGYMKQGRLLLASSATDGCQSANTLSFGFRGYNDISLHAKRNAPGVQPDDAGNPAVTPFLGTPASFNLVQFSGESLNLVEGVDLALNASRYRLVSRNGGVGSGLARFSGRHGLGRAQWGGDGDSSLILETIRTGGAAANTVATVSWDDMTVTEDSTPILDEPWWDFQATYNNTDTTTITGDYRLWLPATEAVVRGVILIGPGSSGDYRPLVHDPVAQEAARALGFGLLGYTNRANLNFWTENSARIRHAVQAVLDNAATVSGRPELRNAPLCITGNSAGGFDSTYLARFWPERTIAFVAHRGGTSGALQAASKKVPGLFMAGSGDTNALTNPFALKNHFLGWRAAGAQVAYAVNWGVGHTPRGNQSWEATWTWMVEVANLRYPRPLAPSPTFGAPPALMPIEDSAGWLGDNASFSTGVTPSVTHPFTAIAPWANYTGAVSSASWLPNETTARLYRALTSTDRVSRTVVPLHGPLRIVAPAQFADPIPLGETVSIEVDPREFDNASAVANVEFYDGDTLLGTDVAGPEWKWTFVPASTGLRTITVVATTAAGAKRDALRVIHVRPVSYPPIALASSRSVPFGAAATGGLGATDPEDDALSYFVQNQPAHGTLTVDAGTGSYSYQPEPAFAGSDSFTFFVGDGVSVSAPATVRIEVRPPETPASPAGLTARPAAVAGGIALAWTPVSGAADYEIQRSIHPDSGFVSIASLSSSAVSFIDEGLSAVTVFHYRVRAGNAAGEGDWSTVVSSMPWLPPGVEGWRYLEFGSVASEPIAADLSDPDGDGAPNLLEYASGFPPLQAGLPGSPVSAPVFPPSITRVGDVDYLSLAFVRDASVSDVVFTVEAASDLAGEWGTIDPLAPANQISVAANEPLPGLQRIVVKDSHPVSDFQRRFMRLRVVRLADLGGFRTGFESGAGYPSGASIVGLDDPVLPGRAPWTAFHGSSVAPHLVSAANPRSGSHALRVEKSDVNHSAGVTLDLAGTDLDFTGSAPLVFRFSLAVTSYSAGTGNQIQIYLGDPGVNPTGGRYWAVLIFNDGLFYLGRSNSAGTANTLGANLGAYASYADPGGYVSVEIAFDPAAKTFKRVKLGGPKKTEDFTASFAGASLPWLPTSATAPAQLLQIVLGTNDTALLDVDDLALTRDAPASP